MVGGIGGTVVGAALWARRRETRVVWRALAWVYRVREGRGRCRRFIFGGCV